MKNPLAEIMRQALDAKAQVVRIAIEWRHANERIDQIKLEVQLAAAVDEMERTARMCRECSERAAEIL